jgi:hypothetical protein
MRFTLLGDLCTWAGMSFPSAYLAVQRRIEWATVAVNPTLLVLRRPLRRRLLPTPVPALLDTALPQL